MGVSYHLVPTNKTTGKFENLFALSGKRSGNEINKLANVMIQFPQPLLAYFEKDSAHFDFIYSLKEHEVSPTTFDPQIIKGKLAALSEVLKNKDSFPIKRFNYFRYEEGRVFNFLYVSLLGKQLKKIALDDQYMDNATYDINTSFDIFNNYNERGKRFYQQNRVIYVRDSEGNRTTPLLNYDAFPSRIQILKVERDYGFQTEIKAVDLLLKTPWEHFATELENLIATCETCLEYDLGLKAYVSY